MMMLKIVLFVACLAALTATIDASGRQHKRHKGGGGRARMLAGGKNPEPVPEAKSGPLNIPLVGAPTKIKNEEANTPFLRALAQLAVSNYKTFKNFDDPCNRNLEVIKVVNAEVKVVAGKIYDVDFTVKPTKKDCVVKPNVDYKCSATVFVSLQNTQQVKEVKCDDEVDFSSSSDKSNAQLALDTFRTTNNTNDACNMNLRVKEVIRDSISTNRQGIKVNSIIFTIEPSKSDCRYSDKRTYSCTARVEVDTRKVRTIVCDEKIDFSKNSWMAASDNSKFTSYAQVALNEFGYKQKTTCTKNLVVDTVKYAEVQIKNGANYRITFTYKPVLDECNIKDSKYPECTVVVNVPPWSSKKDIQVDSDSIDCETPEFTLKSKYTFIDA